MAIYHLSVKTVSRSAGRSATAAAAYRAGVEIVDQRSRLVFDYRRKSGVESAEMIFPHNVTPIDRSALWNAAEAAEKRVNSTVAREFEIALPAELNAEQRHALAHRFAKALVERHSCVADVCIHAPSAAGDNRNHHAHILLTTRRMTSDGLTEKTRELDDKKLGSENVTRWRETFATMTNEALEAAKSRARVDHRSHADRGIETAPAPHFGPSVTSIKRSGRRSLVVERVEAAVAAIAAAKAEAEADRLRLDTLEALLAEKKRGMRLLDSLDKFNTRLVLPVASRVQPQPELISDQLHLAPTPARQPLPAPQAIIVPEPKPPRPRRRYDDSGYGM